MLVKLGPDRTTGAAETALLVVNSWMSNPSYHEKEKVNKPNIMRAHESLSKKKPILDKINSTHYGVRSTT